MTIPIDQRDSNDSTDNACEKIAQQDLLDWFAALPPCKTANMTIEDAYLAGYQQAIRRTLARVLEIDPDFAKPTVETQQGFQDEIDAIFFKKPPE